MADLFIKLKSKALDTVYPFEKVNSALDKVANRRSRGNKTQCHILQVKLNTSLSAEQIAYRELLKEANQNYLFWCWIHWQQPCDNWDQLLDPVCW